MDDIDFYHLLNPEDDNLTSLGVMVSDLDPRLEIIITRPNIIECFYRNSTTSYEAHLKDKLDDVLIDRVLITVTHYMAEIDEELGEEHEEN